MKGPISIERKIPVRRNLVKGISLIRWPERNSQLRSDFLRVSGLRILPAHARHFAFANLPPAGLQSARDFAVDHDNYHVAFTNNS